MAKHEDKFTKRYAKEGEQYRRAVAATAADILLAFDLDLSGPEDEDTSEETFEQEYERLFELADSYQESWWFNPRWSEQHTAAVCLSHSKYPSSEIFNRTLQSRSPGEDFPFACCASAAFLSDVRDAINEMLGQPQGPVAVCKAVSAWHAARDKKVAADG